MHIFGIAFIGALIATLVLLMFAAAGSVINGPSTISMVNTHLIALLTLVLSLGATIAVFLVRTALEI